VRRDVHGMSWYVSCSDKSCAVGVPPADEIRFMYSSDSTSGVDIIDSVSDIISVRTVRSDSEQTVRTGVRILFQYGVSVPNSVPSVRTEFSTENQYY
jgi:hypothetical protein